MPLLPLRRLALACSFVACAGLACPSLAAAEPGDVVLTLDPGSTPLTPTFGGSIPVANFGSSLSGLSILSTVVGTAVHLDRLAARASPAAHLEVHDWSFGDPGGAYNELRGFNAAHVYSAPGVYPVKLDGKTIAQVVVRTPEPATPVETADGLRAVLAAGGAAQLPPGTMLLDETLTVAPGARLLGSPGGSSQLYWTGGPRRAMIDAYRGGLTVSGVSFASRYNGVNDEGAPDAMRLGGRDNTIVGCRFADVQTAVNGNGAPDGTLVQDCVVGDVGDLRGYLVWAEGRRWTILGNRVPNSTRETPVRLSAVGGTPNCQLALIWGNVLANLARPTEDPTDIAKGALRVEAADYVWVEGNDLTSVAEAGPLGGGDGLNSVFRRARYVVWRNNVHRGPVRLKHGLEHFLMADSRLDFLGGTNGGVLYAVSIEGVDPRFNRVSEDLTIRGNLFNTPRRGDRQVWVEGRVEAGFEFSGNTLVQGRKLKAKPARTAVAFEGGFLPGFVSRNNVFPVGGGHGWPKADAVVQAGGQNDVASYLTESQWLQTGGVEGDAFIDLPMP